MEKHYEAFTLAQQSNKACLEALNLSFDTCKREVNKIEAIRLLQASVDECQSSQVSKSIISKSISSFGNKSLTNSKSLASLAPKRPSIASANIKTIAIQDFLLDSEHSCESDGGVVSLANEDVFVVDPLIKSSSRTPKAKLCMTQPNSGSQKHINSSQIL